MEKMNVREENIERLKRARHALFEARHALMCYDVDYDNLTDTTVEEIRDAMDWADKASELAFTVSRRLETLEGMTNG